MSRELVDKIIRRLNDGRGAAFTEAQRQTLGYVISELRRTWREEQATAIEKLEHRLNKLESLVGTPE